MNLRARTYNPRLGAFTSVDPIEGIMSRSASRNGYSYVEGNPTNLTDPSGECPEGYDWLSCYLYDTATGEHGSVADQLIFIGLYTLGRSPDLWRTELADSDRDRVGTYRRTIQAAGIWFQNAGYRDLLSWNPAFSVAFALQDALQSANPFDFVVALSGMTKMSSVFSNTRALQQARTMAQRTLDLGDSISNQPSLNPHSQILFVDDPLIDNNILTSIALREPEALRFAERYRGKMSIDINVAREFFDWNHDIGDLTRIMNEHGIQFVDAASEASARSLLAPMGRTKLVPDVYIIATASKNKLAFATGDYKALTGALKVGVDAQYFYFEGGLSNVMRAYTATANKLTVFLPTIGKNSSDWFRYIGPFNINNWP